MRWWWSGAVLQPVQYHASGRPPGPRCTVAGGIKATYWQAAVGTPAIWKALLILWCRYEITDVQLSK